MSETGWRARHAYWVCLEHSYQVQRWAVEDGLSCTVLLGGAKVPPGGLDTDFILRVVYPRRYGGGTGAGPTDQLPLDLCSVCTREWTAATERSEARHQ